MANAGNDEYVKTYRIGDRQIELYGTRYADTPDAEFDFYEIFENGICLNEGDPLYEVPSEAELARIVAAR
jgi:hypothetical protein